MARLLVRNFSISIDGFGAGPDQDLENPIGVGGRAVHGWLFATASMAARFGLPEPGAPGVDDDLVKAQDEGIGATIMGRHMFGPDRGEWDLDWTGWWGPEPPYDHEVFVLSNHVRASLPMGKTTFHFVTGGIHEAYDRAMAAADGQDVKVGGGVHTVRQYARAGLLDELHLAVAPVLLGNGERLFEGTDFAAYEISSSFPGERATHVTLVKKAG